VSDDLAHDAHLRAALRHAPDHALAPPSGLSQTILAAARQAHRPVRPAPAPPPVQMRPAGPRPLVRWLRRLFAPRWAGAWAAGLVAALGLGLWLDLGVQPVLERPTVVAERGEQLKAASAHTEAAPAANSSSDTASGAVLAAAKAAPPAPAAENTVAAATPRAASRGGEGAARQRRDTKLAESTRSEAVSPSSEAPRHDAAPAQPAASGAVAAAPAADRAVDTVAATRARAAVAAPAAAPPATAQTNAQPAMAPRTAEVGDALAAASPALTLLRRAQAELASGSARWTWIAPGAATMAPLDDAAQAWLSRVVQLTRGRWVDVGERGEALDALEARWWRDGWPHATLRIEAQGLRWIEPSGRIRYAPLDAAALQRLRSF